MGAFWGAFDVQGHHLIPMRARNEEARETILVRLPPIGGGDLALLWGDATAPSNWESGGVVA